jgi:hypothetical protein
MKTEGVLKFAERKKVGKGYEPVMLPVILQEAIQRFRHRAWSETISASRSLHRSFR